MKDYSNQREEFNARYERQRNRDAAVTVVCGVAVIIAAIAISYFFMKAWLL